MLQERKNFFLSVWNHEEFVFDDLPRTIQLKKITDLRGNLTVVEERKDIPFAIKRVFYLYDIPTAESRGSHAHVGLHQFLICLSGSFDVLINDGASEKRFHLNRPWQGAYIPPMIWASEANFDPGSVCLVLTSDLFNEEDYIRTFPEYIEARKLYDEVSAKRLLGRIENY